jgi:exodeoxyribonuclease VII large subunit
VSAVGHETDVSLTDLVADLRAATPSAAAELLAPDSAELHAQLRQLRGRLDAAMQRRLGALAQRSDRAGLRLESLHPRMRLERGRHRLAMLGQRLDAGMRRRLEQRRQRLELLARTLASVSPLATLARGYAVLREHDSGRVLRRAADVRAGQRVDAQLAEGRLVLRVEGDEPPA